MTSKIKDLRAKYNANGNAVIPNTFQHPNIFIDKLMFYLTAEENVILTFAVRRILGFQENIMSRKDNISLSQFTDGIVAKDGSVLSLGCGLGVQSVRACLDSLEAYKILIPTTEKPSPTKGQEYWLQDNENMIDWDGLEKRKMDRAEKYRIQTRKATKISLKSRCYVQRKGDVERKDTLTLNVTDGVTLNVNTKPTETHETQYGADAPNEKVWKIGNEELPVDWQVGLGTEITTTSEEEFFKKQARDAANLIEQGCAGGGELAYAFMVTRRIVLLPFDAKGQRKAAREMLEAKVKANHVVEATKQLMESRDKRGKPLTVVNLFSVRDTAIGIANQPPAVTSDRPERQIHRATPQEGVIDFAEAKRRGLIPG